MYSENCSVLDFVNPYGTPPTTPPPPFPNCFKQLSHQLIKKSTVLWSLFKGMTAQLSVVISHVSGGFFYGRLKPVFPLFQPLSSPQSMCYIFFFPTPVLRADSSFCFQHVLHILTHELHLDVGQIALASRSTLNIDIRHLQVRLFTVEQFKSFHGSPL
jgi:hypothetical protein